MHRRSEVVQKAGQRQFHRAHRATRSRFGLEYLEMDPWAYYPILGTGTGISFYRDIDKTCASIAKISLVAG